MEKVLPGGIYRDLVIDFEVADGEQPELFMVPDNRVIELLYGEYKCNTNEAVGDRTFTCYIMAKDYSRVLSLFEITLAASQSKVIDLGLPLPNEGYTAIDEAIQLPRKFLLSAGMSLRFTCTEGKLGDNLSFNGKYIEWID